MTALFAIFLLMAVVAVWPPAVVFLALVGLGLAIGSKP